MIAITTAEREQFESLRLLLNESPDPYAPLLAEHLQAAYASRLATMSLEFEVDLDLARNAAKMLTDPELRDTAQQALDEIAASAHH